MGRGGGRELERDVRLKRLMGERGEGQGEMEVERGRKGNMEMWEKMERQSRERKRRGDMINEGRIDKREAGDGWGCCH